MNYDIYCDESGNTGANFLDLNQPLYVISGWLVERNTSYRAKDKIIDLRKNNFPQLDELKGSKLLKNSKGKKFCANFLKEMGKLGCTPFFIVSEKRYCLAAKIVEAFFDNEYNSRISYKLSWNPHIKKIIAQIIYDISEESIEMFAEVHKDPSIGNIKATQIQLIKEFRENGYEQLAYAVEGSNSNLEGILEEETYTAIGLEKRALKTLNYPVFVSFLQLIEVFSRDAGLRKVRMIHDEVAQFKKVFPEIFQMYNTNKNPNSIILSNGCEMVFSTLKLRHFEMGDSKKHPLIQAGDLLSSTINYYITKILNKQDIDPELSSIGEFLGGAILVNDQIPGRGFCDFIWSTQLERSLINSIGFESKKRNSKLDLDIGEFLLS